MLLPIAANALTPESHTLLRHIHPTTQLDTLSSTYRHIEAMKHWVNGDTLAARHHWEAIISVDSNYAPAHYYLSHISDGGERNRHAALAYNADSMNKWYAHNYATTLVEEENFMEAIPVYRHITQLDHRNFHAYFALAILYSYNNMPYSAISILDSAEMRIGYNQQLFELQQDLLLYTHLYDRAIEIGKRRVSEHPYDSEIRTSLAGVYDAAGRDSMARVTYEEAFRLDSNNVATLAALSEYYSRRGDLAQMFNYEERLFANDEVSVEDKLRRLSRYTTNTQFYLANFLRIERLIQSLAIQYPNDRGVVDVYASHLFVSGNPEMAIEYFLRHLNNDEQTTPLDYISIMIALVQMDDTEGVIETLNIALERFPNDTDLATFAATVWRGTGDYKKAIKILKDSLKLPKSDEELSELWQGLGDTYYVMERTNKAAAAYRKSLDYNPDNAATLNNYACLITEHGGDLNDAHYMADKAVYLQPENANYLDTLARTLYLLRYHYEAKPLMQRALSIDGQHDPQMLANYGDILWALGEAFMAETYWQKAVQRGYDAAEMEAHIDYIKNHTTVGDSLRHF